jgi:hypothetical protein
VKAVFYPTGASANSGQFQVEILQYFLERLAIDGIGTGSKYFNRIETKILRCFGCRLPTIPVNEWSSSSFFD